MAVYKKRKNGIVKHLFIFTAFLSTVFNKNSEKYKH